MKKTDIFSIEMQNREFVIFAVIGVLFFFIILFMFLYSICDMKHYRKNAAVYQERRYSEQQIKGNFYDRNSRPLTENLDVCRVYFDRKRDVFTKYDLPKNQCPITQNTAIALLAETLDMEPEALKKKIEQAPKKKTVSEKDFVCVAKNLDIKYLKKVEKLNYRGIFAEKRSMRFYPEGSLASRVLGVTQQDGEPLEGLELSYAKYTQGQEGFYYARCDKFGRPLPNTKKYITDSKGKLLNRIDGNNVILTLDINIQYYAEKALNDMAALYKPECAMCVVMDPKTSEVLAIANYPSYDPNNHEVYFDGMSKNFAVQNMYEPGSTLKTFTVAMGLEKGCGENKVFGKCTNVVAVGKRSRIKCDHGPHGLCTPKNIIAHSCNIGAWFITKEYGKEALYDYFNKFGILGRPCKEFGYEAAGYTHPPEEWVPIDTANLSFGQGLLTSCLSMANGYCAIACGGIYHTPKIIKEIKKPTGEIIRGTAKDEGKRIISEETAKKLAGFLAACVNEGTGKTAEIEGIQSAGKTGSAQIYTNGSYKSGSYLVSFMGFAPAENPDLVCAVMVDRPKGSSYGAVVAAPVWQKTMAKALKYRQVY